MNALVALRQAVGSARPGDTVSVRAELVYDALKEAARLERGRAVKLDAAKAWAGRWKRWAWDAWGDPRASRRRARRRELAQQFLRASTELSDLRRGIEGLAAQAEADVLAFQKAETLADARCPGAGGPLRAGWGCSRAFAEDLRKLLRRAA